MSAVALVTGASSGVGEALAPLLAAAGYRVYGMSRRSVELVGVTALPADLTDSDAVFSAVAQLIKVGGRLDVVVHCAGAGGAGAVENMNAEKARQIMEINFWGTWNICRATLPHLRNAPTGKMILLSSIAGHMGIPFRSVYCASKAGVIALSDSLRLELKGSSVQVTCLSPGDMATNSIATQYRQPATELDLLYRSRYEKADKAMVDNVAEGMDAGVVAREILRIVQKKQFAPRYTIGEPVQKLSVIARRLLPAPAWEWLLSRYYT